jgi:hypothetical protein
MTITALVTVVAGHDVCDDCGMTDQLRWLVSWDGLMHAFKREQPAADFAVMAICRHISRPASVKEGHAQQCMGCLVVMGQAMETDDAWR